MSAISKVLGIFLKAVYDLIASILPTEPASISFFALSIIIATIIIKLLVLPISISMIKNQKKMAEFQPEIEKLKKKYKNDPQTLAIKQQELYKESNYNPLAGCLPMIIQMVVLIAFYRVFLEPAKYAFTDPEMFAAINKNFFFVKDLEEIDKTMVLGAIAAITTFLSTYITTKNPATKMSENPQTKSMSTMMMVIMPIMIFNMGRTFQSGLVLYWIVGNVFAIVQQLITNRIISKNMAEEVK